MTLNLAKSLKTGHRIILGCMLLALGTFGTYWRVLSFDFIKYDEAFLVIDNPIVRSGLTLQGTLWALTTSWFDYWHPLTWLSHMLDCQVFGLRPGWHHLTNLVFHVANTLLIFTLFQRMTDAWWRSSLVAGLFALHPAHVESVAWVAERKDVLSTFFFLLTIWTYVLHVENSRAQPSAHRPLPQPTRQGSDNQRHFTSLSAKRRNPGSVSIELRFRTIEIRLQFRRRNLVIACVSYKGSRDIR